MRSLRLEPIPVNINAAVSSHFSAAFAAAAVCFNFILWNAGKSRELCEMYTVVFSLIIPHFQYDIYFWYCFLKWSSSVDAHFIENPVAATSTATADPWFRQTYFDSIAMTFSSDIQHGRMGIKKDGWMGGMWASKQKAADLFGGKTKSFRWSWYQCNMRWQRLNQYNE